MCNHSCFQKALLFQVLLTAEMSDKVRNYLTDFRTFYKEKCENALNLVQKKGG